MTAKINPIYLTAQFARIGIFVMALFILNGCGSDSSSNSDDGQTAQQDPVQDSDILDAVQIGADLSPLAGMSGIKVALDEGSDLYVLNEDSEATQLSVVTDKTLTDGDMSAAIGDAFLQFRGSVENETQAVIVTNEILLGILVCDTADSECAVAPLEILSDDSASFYVEPNSYYVVERASE